MSQPAAPTRGISEGPRPEDEHDLSELEKAKSREPGRGAGQTFHFLGVLAK